MKTENLSVLEYANGFTSWHYAVPGMLSNVWQPSYFEPAKGMLRPGDLILCVADYPDGFRAMHVVVKKTNPTIEIGPMTHG